MRESDNPLRAVVGIDIPTDNTAVVVTETNSTHCRFSIIYTGETWGQPIRGTISTTGQSTIYTRGVDRPTSIAVTTGYWFAFGQADKLWKSFQTKVADSLNKNRGQADAIAPIWKVVL